MGIFQTLENQYDEKINENFIKGFEIGLVSNLDKMWLEGNTDKYNETVENIKSKGIRVFRNNDGKHKLQFTP